MQMSSRRPYLVRTIYEWINDNQCTACILVDAAGYEVVVPDGLVDEDGTIVFNISPVAVEEFSITQESAVFNACFSGKPCDICIPVDAIMAIYAAENGEGLVLESVPVGKQDTKNTKDSSVSASKCETKKKGPVLKVVK